MGFDHRHYVPCLLWKQGEYQAVMRLSTSTKKKLTPLIEAPELGWDFELGRTSKTIDDLLPVLAKRLLAKWEFRPCFVDLRRIPLSMRMKGGAHPVEFLFGALRDKGCNGVPVTASSRDKHYQKAVRNVVATDDRGACIRLSVEEAAKPSVRDVIAELLSRLGTTAAECDMALDLGAPSFSPIQGFAKAIASVVKRLPHLSRWRTLTILAASSPLSLAGIERGSTRLLRGEWPLYRAVVDELRSAGTRLPTFGDYGIGHPAEVPNMDMRKIKPAGRIRYAVDDGWFIIKGTSVRDGAKFEQYVGHCKALIVSGHYSGANFSWGDRYIRDCAEDDGSTGTLTMWKQVGTNHHIETVTQDIASLFGP